MGSSVQYTQETVNRAPAATSVASQTFAVQFGGVRRATSVFVAFAMET